MVKLGEAYLNHDEGVAGLHAENEVVVVVRAADLGKLKRRLHHSAGGIAVEAEDAG